MEINNYLKNTMKIVSNIFFIFPIDEKKIFITCFDGKNYGYDAKAFVEHINTNYPNEYKLYWGFTNSIAKKKVINDNIRLVKMHTIRGIYHLITSGIFIYNINPPSYVKYRKNQILINTWHGFGFKKPIVESKEQFNLATAFISHCQKYEELVLKDAYEYRGTILRCGAPRNDIFFSNKKNEKIFSIKKKLSILEKKVLLFAPTFRENFNAIDYMLDYSLLMKALIDKFCGEWIILNRLHPMINRKNIEIDGCLDVTDYQDMQDLLLISDILITDYSSTAWDFIQCYKPVFIFATDLEEYEIQRGFLIPHIKWPYDIAKSNTELVNNIMAYDNKKYLINIDRFLTDEMKSCEKGKACETIMKYVINIQSQSNKLD